MGYIFLCTIGGLVIFFLLINICKLKEEIADKEDRLEKACSEWRKEIEYCSDLEKKRDYLLKENLKLTADLNRMNARLRNNYGLAAATYEQYDIAEFVVATEVSPFEIDKADKEQALEIIRAGLAKELCSQLVSMGAFNGIREDTLVTDPLADKRYKCRFRIVRENYWYDR